jgi:hypothetical protein
VTTRQIVCDEPGEVLNRPIQDTAKLLNASKRCSVAKFPILSAEQLYDCVLVPFAACYEDVSLDVQTQKQIISKKIVSYYR